MVINIFSTGIIFRRFFALIVFVLNFIISETAAFVSSTFKSSCASCCVAASACASVVKPSVGHRIRCCNSVARVLRCQRRSRGFESLQHRFGKGRLGARTLVCETKDMGASPILPPIDSLGSVGEQLNRLPVTQPPQGIAGAIPATPTICPGSPTGRDACLRSRRLVVRIHSRANIPKSSNGRTRRLERRDVGSIPAFGDFCMIVIKCLKLDSFQVKKAPRLLLCRHLYRANLHQREFRNR